MRSFGGGGVLAVLVVADEGVEGVYGLSDGGNERCMIDATTTKGVSTSEVSHLLRVAPTFSPRVRFDPASDSHSSRRLECGTFTLIHRKLVAWYESHSVDLRY